MLGVKAKFGRGYMRSHGGAGDVLAAQQLRETILDVSSFRMFFKVFEHFWRKKMSVGSGGLN